jgi:hypothetical protein
MNLISDIRLKWYDDSSLHSEDKRKLLELFLDSVGVSRDVPADIFEVLLIARSKGIGLTAGEIREGVLQLRERRGLEVDKSLSSRNMQIWLKFFRDLELVERMGSRYHFAGNKKPSALFIERTKPNVIDKSADYIYRLLQEIEKGYSIK